MGNQVATSLQLRHRHDGAGSYRGMSWKHSYWVIALIAILIGVLTIPANIAWDWATKGFLRGMLPSDILDAVVAAVVSGFVLLRMQAHRRELLVRMQIIEDVNHHLRNALEAITLSSSLRQDKELDAKVKDAYDRIDWVLRDVLPRTVGNRGSETADSRWHSGRRLRSGAIDKRGRGAHSIRRL